MLFKKNFLILIFCISIFSITYLCISKSDQKIKTGLSRQSFIRNKKHKINYFLYLPENYYKNKNVKWPLIIYLHSMAGKGDDLGLFRWTIFPVRLDNEKNFKFIVICPQYSLNENYLIDYKFLDNQFMKEIAGKYSIDQKRIYLTGVSYGGHLAWKYGIQLSDWFAAIAPIAGFGVFKHIGDTTPRIPEGIEKLCSMPIWIFHGKKDSDVAIAHPNIIINKLKKCNKNIKYTIYPDKGHYIRDTIFENDFLFEWFLKHKKN